MLPWQLLVKFVTSLSSSWYYSHVIMVSWYRADIATCPRLILWFVSLQRPSQLDFKMETRSPSDCRAHTLVCRPETLFCLRFCLGSLWLMWFFSLRNLKRSLISCVSSSSLIRTDGEMLRSNIFREPVCFSAIGSLTCPPGRSTQEFTCKLSQESPECQQTLPTSPLFLFCLIADFTAWTSGDKITIMTSGNNRRWPTCSAPVTLSSLTPGHQIPEAASSARVSIPQCVCVCL